MPLNSIRPLVYSLATFFLLTLPPLGFGGVPALLNFQGRIVIGGVSYNGTGQFQFALVDRPGTNTFWSNDGTGAGGGEPSAAISLALTNGLYAVVLGDTNVSGMSQPIDPDTFTNARRAAARVVQRRNPRLRAIITRPADCFGGIFAGGTAQRIVFPASSPARSFRAMWRQQTLYFARLCDGGGDERPGLDRLRQFADQ